MSLAASDSAAIVVNGGVKGGGGPPARLYAAVPGVSSLIDVALPSDEPLYNLSSWWTGEEFVIVGLPCPEWVEASHPPDADFDSLTGFSDGSGHGHVLDVRVGPGHSAVAGRWARHHVD